jgi:bifunctional non-homologous end joining protein LigD
LTPTGGTDVEIEGRQLRLTNLDKVLYPQAGFAKRDVLTYYAKIAPIMVPHLACRPATFRRYPDGVEGKSFFEKNVPSHAPSWVKTVVVPSNRDDEAGKPRDTVKHVVIGDTPTLIWAANLAALELHVPLWRSKRSGTRAAHPDFGVFDLDPGPGTSVVDCGRLAIWIADFVEANGHERPLVKTSGSKGLQLYLRYREAITWDQARDWALGIAEVMERDHPELVVTSMSKAKRGGKILIDWSQNHPVKTTVAVYSLRARPEPTVSTPVTWDEVATCVRSGDPDDLTFRAFDVLERVERDGDLFASLIA